jgi:prepilin-type N-terminal cleavage/methylation domain-containing protein
MKPARGFSLIELSIVLFIGAILLTMGLRAINAQLDNSSYSASKSRQEIIKDALSVYLGKNGRLPCPDTSATPDGIEDRNNVGNVAVCVRFFGVLPYATLGLSKEVALDGWENFIAYGVSPKWTLTYNAAAAANTPQTTVATDAFNVGYTGVLTISDRVPATNATPTNISTSAVVALISYGKNGNGAITVKGSQNVPPAAGTDEFVNVNVGGAGTQYFKRDYTDTQVATYGAFDDLVRVIEASELIAPLTKDGSLVSASGSLNQTISAINDAILGSAIQTHAPGTPSYVLPGAIPAGVPILDPWGNNITYAIVVPGGSVTAATAAGIAYTLTSKGPDGNPATADDIVITMQITRLQGIFGKLGY